MNLYEIAQAVESLGVSCSCGAPVLAMQVRCYSHSGGVEVDGYDGPQWVYFQCPRCSYDTALWKLLNKARGLRARGREIEVLQEAV